MKIYLLLLGLISLKARGEDFICDRTLDFTDATVGTFPTGWTAKYESHMPEILAQKLYVVEENEGRKALHGTYGTHTITLLKDLKGTWKLKEYPIFQWSWKAIKLPTGGDESQLGKNDSAASIYVAWKSNFIQKIKANRYAWSSTQPVGSHFSRRFGNDQIIIKESGPAKLGKWQTAHTNVLEDYQNFMGKEKDPPDPVGLALTSDADATKSSAEAYYADFKLCRLK